MARDPRKFKGRAQIDLGAMFGATGGGDVIPMEPGEVDFNDATFDANTQTRFKPKSGFKDFMSGGQASAAANDINNAQILGDQEFSNQIRRSPELTKIAVERERQLKKVGVDSAVDQAKQLDANRYNTSINRIAAARANELDGDWAIYEPDDEDIPKADKVYARKQYADFGDMIDKVGVTGSDTGNKASVANTEHQRKLTEQIGKKERQILNDGSYVDGDKLFRWNPPGMDAEGNPTKGFYTPFDLKAGLAIGEKAPTALDEPEKDKPSAALTRNMPDSVRSSEAITDADLTDYNIYRLLNEPGETFEDYGVKSRLRKNAKQDILNKQQRYIMKPY